MLSNTWENMKDVVLCTKLMQTDVNCYYQVYSNFVVRLSVVYLQLIVCFLLVWIVSYLYRLKESRTFIISNDFHWFQSFSKLRFGTCLYNKSLRQFGTVNYNLRITILMHVVDHQSALNVHRYLFSSYGPSLSRPLGILFKKLYPMTPTNNQDGRLG